MSGEHINIFLVYHYMISIFELGGRRYF
jgi:hypothetical protein